VAAKRTVEPVLHFTSRDCVDQTSGVEENNSYFEDLISKYTDNPVYVTDNLSRKRKW